MSTPDRCPHCDRAVETEVVDIDGLESRRFECPSCEEVLVAKPCPACAQDAGSAAGEAADASAACDRCGGNRMVLETLGDLLS
ncbi:MAG: hypothetical protein ABEJ05_02270 [Haloglomus sp.]